jgi:hypothetical protein
MKFVVVESGIRISIVPALPPRVMPFPFVKNTI